MSERILKMPRLGETMDEGKIVGWLIRPGDSFRRGDPIIEIETDKTIAEFPALGDGTLNEVLVAIGDTVEVGVALARIDIGSGPDWTAEDGAQGEPAAEAAAISTKQPGGWIEADLAMPRLGETMEEGRVAKWLKTPGEAFARGEAIIEIETDKTIAEFPALSEGRLVRILRGEGEMVTVGDPIARIEVPADSIAHAEEAPVASKFDDAAVAVAQTPSRKSVPVDGRVRATPLARRLARNHGLDITTIGGTGRRGRVEKEDVLAATGAASMDGVSVPADVRFAALKRGRMAYLDIGAGSGNAVLLLHGFSGDRTTWAGVAAGLKRAGKRVIVPDLPGHGLTGIEAENSTELSHDLSAFLDTLDIDRIDVVAHSLGAVAALDLALKTPQRIASLSLIAPAGFGSEIDGHFIRGMAGARTAGEVAHLLRRLSVNGVELSDAALSALAADLAKGRLVALAEAIAGPSGQRVDSLSALHKLTASVPVRVLFGLEDKIIPWKHVLSLPPRVAVHLLSRSGHMPQWDQTKDVVDILLA